MHKLQKVTVYIREHSTRALRTATIKDDNPNAIFVLRFGTSWETLPKGTDFAHARIAAINKQTAFKRGEATIPTPKAREKSPGNLDVMIDEYLESIEEHRSHRTALAYALSLRAFYASCQLPTVADVTKDTLKNFVKAMKREGLADRSIANRVANVVCFLRAHDSDVTVRHKYTEKTVRAYREDEVRAFFAACTNTPYWLLFQFFLCTGAREQEVMHAEFSDIDFKDNVYNVTSKPHWRPKDLEEREIPIPARLIEALQELKKSSKTKLIFPTPAGKPDGHMLRHLKKIVKDAGLAGHWELHKWRKTYATLQARDGVDIKILQQRLGHSDIATTIAYLEGEDARSDRSQKQVNNTFSMFV
jgi:integrase